MPSSTTSFLRGLIILLGVVVLASGCTTAKTMGTAPASAVAATPAPSSDGDAEQASTGTTVAEASSSSSDSSASSSDSSASSSDSDSSVAEASSDSDAASSGDSTATGDGGKPLQSFWVVGKGDHLWGISAHERVYGDPYQWPLLFKRNRHQIEDADLIYPGQILRIERDLTTAEVQRAIDHAKSRGAWVLGITELSDIEYLSRER